MKKLWSLFRSKSNEYQLHKTILKITYIIRLIYVCMIVCVGMTLYTYNLLFLIGIMPLYLYLKNYNKQYIYYNKQAIKHCMDVMFPVFDEMMIHAENEKRKKIK